jgi:proteasome accessory factor B
VSQSISSRVPVEERLFSLVLALLATETGLTKNEILSTVQGYRQKYSASGDNANLERQFERDKDDIRELGVPLETLDSPGQSGNNQNLRYRIPRGAYELPSDITFSAEETTILGLAAMVWREGSLSAESRRAIVKLRSLGITSDEPVLGYVPRLRVRDATFEPLRAALEKNAIVRFAYLKPGQTDAVIRTVAPLALVQYQGRWHLHAEEPDTGLTKTFLLRRIVTQITTTGKTFTPPAGDQSAKALREIEAVWSANTVEVTVEPDSDAATRLHKRRGTEVSASGNLVLHYADANIVADELAGYGPEVVVVSPQAIRTAVKDRLLRVAGDHSAGDHRAADDGAANHGADQGRPSDG